MTLSIGLLKMQEERLKQLLVKLLELQRQREEKQRELLEKQPGLRGKQLRQLPVKLKGLLSN